MSPSESWRAALLRSLRRPSEATSTRYFRPSEAASTTDRLAIYGTSGLPRPRRLPIGSLFTILPAFDSASTADRFAICGTSDLPRPRRLPIDSLFTTQRVDKQSRRKKTSIAGGTGRREARSRAPHQIDSLFTVLPACRGHFTCPPGRKPGTASSPAPAGSSSSARAHRLRLKQLRSRPPAQAARAAGPSSSRASPASLARK